MSKIKLLRAENFKAIENFEAEFKGCSAIITAGNDKGKTSFLRGLIERIRFNRPDVIVRRGAEEGQQEMILDTGEKFIWEYDVNGFDKLSYVTDKNVKKNVTKEMGSRFFPEGFDVDKFLNSTPKEQRKQLQAMANVDFTEVDTRYNKAYENRTEKNAEAERFHVKLTKMLEVPKVDFVDMDSLKKKKDDERSRLNGLYSTNKASNDKLREAHNAEKSKVDNEVSAFNNAQAEKQRNIQKMAGFRNRIVAVLEESGELENLVSVTKLEEYIKTMPQPEPDKIASNFYPKEPEYIKELPDDSTLQAIDAEILTATETNQKAQAYKDYIDFKTSVDKAKIEADEANILVNSIDEERTKMIASANFPEGVSMNAEGVTVDGLPFLREQLSSSVIYKTALKIAAMKLGEVKTLYFDASYLDKNSFTDIVEWAEKNGLQLLVEKPDWNDGEITYELIEQKAA